jgi:hypothetical protein
VFSLDRFADAMARLDGAADRFGKIVVSIA